MGHSMRLELTRVCLLVKLANRYTTKGDLNIVYLYITRKLKPGYIVIIRVDMP